MIENNFELQKEKDISNYESQTVFKQLQPSDIRVPMKTSTGLPENIAGALSYLFGFISGFIMLLVERENHFVRYHALQSIYISIVFIGVFVLLGMISIFSWFSSMFLAPGGLVLWIILLLNAYKGRYSKMMYISDFANKHL